MNSFQQPKIYCDGNLYVMWVCLILHQLVFKLEGLAD